METKRAAVYPLAMTAVLAALMAVAAPFSVAIGPVPLSLCTLVIYLAGYLLGAGFEHYISSFDHWIAFLLLAFIGGKMIWEAVRGGEEEHAEALSLKLLVMMAVATSIDALAVGITFAFLRMDILSSALTIGATTFLISFGGVAAGNRFGARYKKKAEIVGGVVLILIGVKILLEHLGILVL